MKVYKKSSSLVTKLRKLEQFMEELQLAVTDNGLVFTDEEQENAAGVYVSAEYSNWADGTLDMIPSPFETKLVSINHFTNENSY